MALPPTNFVHLDEMGRMWITVSTKKVPRSLGYRKDVSDGVLILATNEGARVVADGLGYTNECALHPDGRHLYVNETFGRRLSRFPVHNDGSLGDKEEIAEFGAATFPDGMAFDAEGRNLDYLDRQQQAHSVEEGVGQTIMLEDTSADHIEWVEAAFPSRDHGAPT